MLPKPARELDMYGSDAGKGPIECCSIVRVGADERRKIWRLNGMELMGGGGSGEGGTCGAWVDCPPRLTLWWEEAGVRTTTSNSRRERRKCSCIICVSYELLSMNQSTTNDTHLDSIRTRRQGIGYDAKDKVTDDVIINV